MTAALELPAPDGATVVRAAISAAEALRSLRWATMASHGRRHEEALVAVRVLGATLEDAEDYEEATTARSIAGRLRLADVEARDVEGFEAWCREIAARALPPSEETDRHG